MNTKQVLQIVKSAQNQGIIGDLSGADLRGADLRRANLSEANLRWARWDYTSTCLAPAPEGSLIVWGKKSGRIVKMNVGPDVPRSCATTRKHRSASALVLEVEGDETQFVHETKWGKTVYAEGEIVTADSWDENRWEECSHGIHWFLSREEAVAWVE